MKLTLTLQDELSVMSKYNLTPTELLVLQLLILAQEGEIQYLKEYFLIENCRIHFRDTLISLQDKQILLKSYKIPKNGEKFIVDDVEINKNVVKTIYKSSCELGKELFEHYPQFGNINGNLIPIRSISKKFNSFEEAFNAYGKAIKWNQETHNEIIELLDWAKEYNIVNKTLCNFICDHTWNDLKTLKEGDNVNINYDTVKML